MKPILFTLILLAAINLKAQQAKDTTLRRNTIKLDITSYWLYRNAIVLAYERVVNHNQTWGITAGYQLFPPLGAIDNIDVTRSTNASGIKLGGEYRFYLKKENKYGAPHGVYIGPYATFHNYSNTRSLEVDNNGTIEYADLKMDLNILNIGVQLGYQFVLNNRWTIDLVFIGPSISNYRVKMKLDGTYTFDPEDVSNEILEALLDRFPGFNDLLANQEISSSGKLDTWGYGYRYQFQVGYHFGRKKN